MKRALLCVVVFFFIKDESSAHPLKMAYTSVKYSAVKKVFEITHRVFQDDFENTLREEYNYSGGDVFINQKNQITQKFVNDFFQKNFSIKFNKTAVNLKFVKTEQKNQMGIIVYYETEKVDLSKISSIQIYNFIMMESFKEQVNMFHLNINDEIKRTIKFEIDKTNENLLF
ncbi:hypothetical protein MYP_1405 [Sporocytophaga myxococcoides]|uniref:Uncharacterized protein n=1 Tax=Sporocytophaga myxococcoides TaxID=153721 RepID=A0A098LCI2_9BACT|nr:DUF6702 family protein [Sporocytophaga myxococcoides]GAL84177.1 hypothetical protein MYP_1405 [Sporocytophaga myxococcoides]